MTNKVFKRFYEIARGTNTDASNEYYTMYHSFAQALLELICRHTSGKTYKMIICPCDSETSIFRELPKYRNLIGDPQIIYTAWPDKDWKDYFNMDYEKAYGFKSDEVCIFTNPPFKGLTAR